MDPNTPQGMLLWGLLAIVVIALIMRVVVLWYWKIDRIVEALESIDESLRYLPAVVQGRITRAKGNRRAA